MQIAPVKPNNQKKLFEFFTKKDKLESSTKTETPMPAPKIEAAEVIMEI